MQSEPSSSGNQNPQEFFTDLKRSETRDLRFQLKRALDNIKKPKEQLIAVEKVIHHMTMGADVSPLFGEMVIAANTRDIRQKKLVYHYLCYYAAQQPELSLLSVNTLQRDCSDHSPTIRGLALRAMGNLRVGNIVEYLVPLIERGLSDPIPYVRKTAVLNIVKLFQVAPNTVSELKLPQRIRQMILDENLRVSINSIVALQEIVYGGHSFPLTKDEVMHLLNQFDSMSEWELCIVLNELLLFTPDDDEEMFEIMNLLDIKLRHSNSAVVLGAVKILLKYTEDSPQLYQSAVDRIRTPLITLVSASASTPEIVWTSLLHLKLMNKRFQGQLFADDYRCFFVKYNEPEFIKNLRIDLLIEVATSNNTPAILEELAHYVTDFLYQSSSRKAVQAIGDIAFKVPDSSKTAVATLVSLLDSNIVAIASSIMVVMVDILRIFPDHAPLVTGHLGSALSLRKFEDIAAANAILWIVGSFGENVAEAPYLLEEFVDEYDKLFPSVRLSLLIASAKLFFKRPGETKPILGTLLFKAVNDMENVDVHDRALLYSRLFEQSLEDTQKVICAFDSLEPRSHFTESEELETLDRLFEEFNTLSVVYEKPSELFITQPSVKTSQPVLEPVEQYISSISPPNVDTQGDLLGDLVDLVSQPATPPILVLQENPSIPPQIFQEKWGSLPHKIGFEESLYSPLLQQKIELIHKTGWLFTVASGHVSDIQKFYLFSRNDTFVFLTELLIGPQSLITTIKSNEEAGLNDYYIKLKSLLI